MSTTYGATSAGATTQVVDEAGVSPTGYGAVCGSYNRGFSYDSLSRLSAACNPESATTGYGYDNDFNLTSRTDARGIQKTLGYDALNRLISTTYNDGVTPAVSYGYLGNGDFLSVVASSNGSSYT